MAKVKKAVGKGLDVLILVTALLIIAGLLTIGWFTLKGAIGLIVASTSLETDLFFAGLLVGAAGGIMYFLEMWINALNKAWKSLTNKQEAKK